MALKRKRNNKSKEKPIDFKFNLALYWDFIKKYKMIILVILLLIFFFQVFHVTERYLFKLLMDKGAEYLSNVLPREEFVTALIIIAVVFLSLLIIQVIFRWIWLSLINKFESSAMLDLKKRMFDHVIHLDHEFHVSNKTGSMISKLIRGSGAVERLSDVFLFNFAPLLFQVIVVSGSIFLFDSLSALVVLVTIGLFIGYSFYINRMQQSANMRANDAEDEEKAVISDYLMNIESIKYFGKEQFVKRNYMKYGLATKRAMLTHWNYFRALSAGHTFILGLGVFFLMYFPIQKLLAHEMTVGTLIFIYTSFGVMMGHLFGFDHGLRGFYRSMADFESLFKYYKAKKTVLDKHEAKCLKITKGSIKFENVFFRYKKKYVLKDFNLEIKPMTRVALVGPSGSGKSTLVKALYRLYDVSKGRILIDDKDINDVKQESLRSELSIVPQEAVLFDDSLYNNISFSRMNASRKEVMRAMKFAQLDKVVANFPEKENTIVGERGVKLSGGEKQRVSMARAILANKKILVLDEATSALDSNTEFEIQKDLEKLLRGRTSIVIAHRLSTIMKADVIIVMDKGSIVQKGTHQELIEQEGLYKKLWSLQKGGYIK
ncbi:ABC transporter ATP-binding protein/permease [Candidatus Woesearchaeota archaeon]|nr:ABC transporter ATP-binding protein/permease [Candidatus Woesearchaeota archaeon]